VAEPRGFKVPTNPPVSGCELGTQVVRFEFHDSVTMSEGEAEYVTVVG
jgi:hypothetical protein